ncbi:hypothetical protein BCD58_06200 [Neisseria meningitidis]|nr:hypothetical protein [Neisseria meningitidis]
MKHQAPLKPLVWLLIPTHLIIKANSLKQVHKNSILMHKAKWITVAAWVYKIPHQPRQMVQAIKPAIVTMHLSIHPLPHQQRQQVRVLQPFLYQT